MSDDQEALATARGLTGALDGMAAQLQAVGERVEDQAKTQEMLVTYGRRNRHLIRLTFTSIILDVIVTVLLVFVYGQAHDAHAISEAQHVSLVAGCQSNNEFKAEQVALWEHLISVSQPKPGTTKAQAAADAQKAAAFLQYIQKVFSPRNCAAAYKLP